MSPRTTFAGEVFKSAQANLLLGVVTVLVAAAVLLAMHLLGWTSNWSGIAVGTFAVLPVLMTYSAVWMATEYLLVGDSLDVRCGVLRWRIGYPEIVAVRPVWSLRPAPALTVRRLRIEYRDGLQLQISPLLRERFLAALAARCPQLRRDGDSLLPVR